MNKITGNRMLKALIPILFLTILLNACKKKDENPTDNNTPPKLAITHASPGAPEISLYADGTKLGSSISYLAFADYITSIAGKKELSLTLKDQSNQLAKTTFEFKQSTNYGLFIVDVPGKTSLLITEDDLTNPATGKAKIRFINLSPDAGNLDFNVKGKQALFSNMAFKSTTKFEQMDAANEVVFELRETGKPELLFTSPILKMEAGKIYTVFARGLRSSNEDTLKLGLTTTTNK
jgi:hypothetical protein